MQFAAGVIAAVLLAGAQVVHAQARDSASQPVSAPSQSAPVPHSDPGSWITINDYPPSAAWQEREGSVGFTLAVGADGKPRECDVTQSSGMEDLDATACMMAMIRARFDPAHDANGNPVASTFTSAVRFELPRKRLPKEGMATVTYTVEPDGAITDCLIEVANYPLVGKDRSCPDDSTFELPVDSAGNPERRRYRTTFQIERVPLD